MYRLIIISCFISAIISCGGSSGGEGSPKIEVSGEVEVPVVIPPRETSDSIADSFKFMQINNVDLDTWVESDIIIVSGINETVNVSIEDGEYKLESGEYTGSEGLISNNQKIRVRIKSGREYNHQYLATLTVGMVSGQFSIRSKEKIITDFDAPEVTINFPIGNVSQELSKITVRGTAEDDSQISTLRINGIAAKTTNDYHNWNATINLARGVNAIRYEAVDIYKNSISKKTAIKIESQPYIPSPQSLKLDDLSNQAYISDDRRGAIFGVNLTSKQRYLISASKTPSSTFEKGIGPALDSVDEIHLSRDGRRLYVTDWDKEALFEINISNGNRRIISDRNTGSGPILAAPRGLAINEEGAKVFVTDYIRGDIYSVELENGNRTLVSGSNLGSGPNFNNPDSILLVNDDLFVVDTGRDCLIKVDVDTGDRELFSGCGVADGDRFYEIGSMAFDSINNRFLVTEHATFALPTRKMAALYSVDLLSGKRTILSGQSVGNGSSFIYPTQLDISADSLYAYIIDGSRVTKVELATGSREVLLSPSGSFKETWNNISDLYIHADKLIISESSSGIVREKNLATGATHTMLNSKDIVKGMDYHFGDVQLDKQEDSFLFSGGVVSKFVRFDRESKESTLLADKNFSTGINITLIEDVSWDSDQNIIYYSDVYLKQISKIDLTNRSYEILLSPSTINNGWFNDPTIFDMDFENQMILIGDAKTEAVYQFDISSNQLKLVSSYFYDIGEGRNIIDIEKIVWDKENDRALILDAVSPSIISVSTSNGDREIIAGTEHGDGEWPHGAYEMAVDKARDRAFISSSKYLYVVDLISGDRARIHP